MIIRPLAEDNIAGVMDLFCTAFRDDEYYSRIFSDPTTRIEEMRASFEPSIAFCISLGQCFGAFEDDRLISFILCFDYKRAKEDHGKDFLEIFGGDGNRDVPLPYKELIHDRICGMDGRVLYLLSIASAPEYQNLGIGSSLIDYILDRFEDCVLVGDVSNAVSLGMYKKRNFEITEIDSDYYFVCQDRKKKTYTAEIGSENHVIVPSEDVLKESGVAYSLVEAVHYLPNAALETRYGQSCFTKKPDCLCRACVVSLSYDALLCYQRTINLSQFCECFLGDLVFYLNTFPYDERPLMNQRLAEMIKTRTQEWSIVPDVFASVPMQYRDRDKIISRGAPDAGSALLLLRDMDFRTQYEAGIPNVQEEVDDLASFKSRIRRFYLEKVKVQIASEASVDHYEDGFDPIGAAAYVDLYVSVDLESDCAVLTWYALSAPFLISHLLDNIIRNQLQVVLPDKQINFFDYISGKYSLVKRGTPKIYTVIPKGRDCLKPSQTASLLAAETIYPDGENFGEIIDEEILAAVNSPNGMGQYDRAIILAHTNVVLQFSPDFKGSVRQRLEEESITLFYMELILLEEAAIHIADREIIKLFSSNSITEPIEFLKKVDVIYDDYCKTTDFWDIQVNYPTSQKSIDMLRNAFHIKDQLEFMQRNQSQLQTVFDTKCDIIDRRDSKRMDVSLAIISVLAVFSAWIDGHDYIATWGDLFPASTIHVLQRALFVVILITAVYAVIHLFGSRVRALFAARRQRIRKMYRRKDRKKGRTE